MIYNRTTDANIYYKNVKYVHDVADDVIRKRRKTLVSSSGRSRISQKSSSKVLSVAKQKFDCVGIVLSSVVKMRHKD